MTGTVTAFSPTMTLAELRANGGAGVRATLGTVATQWFHWAHEIASNPASWTRWMSGGPGDWSDNDALTLWTRDLNDFLAWARNHPEQFATPTPGPIRIPDLIVSRGYHTPIEHARQIRLAVLAQGTEPLQPIFRQWQQGVTTSVNRQQQVDRLVGPMLAGDELNDEALRFFMGALHFAHEQQPHLFEITDDYREPATMTTTTVPSGDTATVLEIGPDTPGWDAWWAEVAEAAQEDGYEEQYNILARAFGATEIDEEREYDVQLRIEPFYVTVTVRGTAAQMSNGEYDLSQTDVDDAIREHIRERDVEYMTEGYEQV